MNYHFVSDDSFFLSGVSVIKLFGRKQLFLHHASLLSDEKYPRSGDIVVLNIADIIRRKQILLEPWVAYCRVIILLRMKNEGRCQTLGRFPWVIPASIRLHTLEYILSCAATCEPITRGITKAQQRLFHYLCRGYSFPLLEKKMKVTAKYLYALKLSTMKKYGLSDGHAAGVLFCRDVTGISLSHDQQMTVVIPV